MIEGLPCLRAEPEIARIAGGPPAAPGSPGELRSRVLFAAAPAPRPAARLPEAAPREVHLLPGLAGGAWPAAERLSAARRAAPRAVLRVEWWAEGQPWRPDPGALAALTGARPLFVHVVLTRPEIPADLAPPIAELQMAGVPVAGDVVLVRGVNDESGLLRQLCLGMLRLGVRPYHLIDGAWLPPVQRVSAPHIETLARSLRGWISGLAVPQWVEEGIDGRRAVRIPPYVTRLDAEGVEVVNYQGRRLRYPNPPERS